MEHQSNKYKILYHKFFVFLPALLIITLITMIYVSYSISYIIPLLQNWNDNIMKNSRDYPFAFTSTNKTSRTKGIFLGITSGFFVILLLLNLLRTIFSDPGYFPSAMDLEFQIVMKNIVHQQENEKEKEEKTEIQENAKKENNGLDQEIEENEDFVDFEKEKEKKRNYFRVEIPIKEKPNKNKENNLIKRNNSEKIYFDQEQSIELYKDDAMNLLNFGEKISESPICYEEYNKRADFLEDWTYRTSNKQEEKIKENGGTPQGNKKKSNYQKNNETDFNITINSNAKSNLIKVEETKSSFDADAFVGFIGYDVGKGFLCGTCIRLKVERSHHCKQCGKCVLKMDHHCPWLANCIGYRNYKFFLLTHLYGSISCFIVLASYWETFINATFDLSKSIFVVSWHLFIFVCTFGLFAFLVWLFVINWGLMFQGLTVIENADRERFPSAKFKNNFDLGYYKNFKSVFGESPLIWFLPISPDHKYKRVYFEKSDAKHEKLMMLL